MQCITDEILGRAERIVVRIWDQVAYIVDRPIHPCSVYTNYQYYSNYRILRVICLHSYSTLHRTRCDRLNQTHTNM